MSGVKQHLKVLQASKNWVNVAVVRNVVTSIHLGRWVKRTKPQRVNAKVFQVCEPRGDARQVSHS